MSSGMVTPVRVKPILGRFPPRVKMEFEIQRRQDRARPLLRLGVLAQVVEVALLSFRRALDKDDLSRLDGV